MTRPKTLPITEEQRQAYIKRYGTTAGVSRHYKCMPVYPKKCLKCKKRKGNHPRRPDGSYGLVCRDCAKAQRVRRIDPWTELDC